jgi:hypothetical protein
MVGAIFILSKELFRLFPSVQHLKNNDYIQSEQTMIRLIDGFQYLSHASFHQSTLYNNNESNLCQNPNTIIQHSQRLTPDNFTCRIYHSSDNNLLYNWWINEDVCYFDTAKWSLVFFLYSGTHTTSKKL